MTAVGAVGAPDGVVALAGVGAVNEGDEATAGAVDEGDEATAGAVDEGDEATTRAVEEGARAAGAPGGGCEIAAER